MSRLFVFLCDNPACQTVWVGRNPFNIFGFEPAVTTAVNNVVMCPVCKSRAHMADGVYSPTGAVFFSRDDFDRLTAALQDLKRQAEAGATAEDLKRTIAQRYPFLEKHPLVAWLVKRFAEGLIAASLATVIDQALSDLDAQRAIYIENVVINVQAPPAASSDNRAADSQATAAKHGQDTPPDHPPPDAVGPR